MQMLYKSPGAHALGNYPKDATFDYVVVNPHEIEDHLARGWAMTPDEALTANEEPAQSDDPLPMVEVKRRGRPPKVRE